MSDQPIKGKYIAGATADFYQDEAVADEIHAKYLEERDRRESTEADLMAARGEIGRLERVLRQRNREIAVLRSALRERE